MKIIKLKPEDIKLNKRRLERRVMQGHTKAPDWVTLQIESCLKDCEIKPKGIYSLFDCEVDAEKNTIIIEDTIFESSFMAKKFKYAKEVGLFIATIGDFTAEKVKQAGKEKDGVKALIYDSIGSEYAESTADAIHRIIEKEQGYCMSRYSPGYNDWDISEQKKLFELVPGEKIDVKLTESYLMQPEKTVSAMIGISKRKLEGCKTCTKKDCIYRE